MEASVGIYLEKNGENIIIVPFLGDNRVRRASMNFKRLNRGFTNQELGEAIKESIEFCKKNIPEKHTEKVFELASGYKSYSSFEIMSMLMWIMKTDMRL